uniref:Uncharacterized protein n=1 Tax=Oryza meridionalis TaxID=40149 RepID=A0A0E0C509_9ORYZ
MASLLVLMLQPSPEPRQLQQPPQPQQAGDEVSYDATSSDSRTNERPVPCSRSSRSSAVAAAVSSADLG